MRASAIATVAATWFVLAAAPWAVADTGEGSAPKGEDPATSVYQEQAPNASDTTGDAATDVYTEQVPSAGSRGGSSGPVPRARTLEQLLTSPSLGGPQQVQPLPGDAGRSYGSFSFQTVREVAGVGTSRFAVLLAVLFLISLVLAATALSRLQRR